MLPPTAAFTHLTSAELRGWWLPAKVDHPVMAAAWGTTTAVIRAGLSLRRHRDALRRWGAPRLRQAVALLDERSESPWESILRMFHWAADVPVEPQRKVYDASCRFVARGDLWVVGTRRLHEYDGEDHRTPGGHRYDLTMERGLSMIGWQRLGFTRRSCAMRRPTSS